MHRVIVDRDLLAERPGATVVIDGEEAAHAIRVKRLEPGERVQLLDGRGTIAECSVASDVESPGARKKRDAALRVIVDSVQPIAPPTPRLEILSATPKGSRVDDMIDQLSQIGAAAWSPLETSRGVVDPRDSKLGRLHRIAREAAKQSGRAWFLEIGGKVTFKAAFEGAHDIVIADSSGTRYEPRSGAGKPIRLLIGPEGGFTHEELDAARRAGARVCRFGPHVMRIETAAPAAAAIIMNG